LRARSASASSVRCAARPAARLATLGRRGCVKTSNTSTLASAAWKPARSASRSVMSLLPEAVGKPGAATAPTVSREQISLDGLPERLRSPQIEGPPAPTSRRGIYPTASHRRSSARRGRERLDARHRFARSAVRVLPRPMAQPGRGTERAGLAASTRGLEPPCRCAACRPSPCHSSP
jgi:hypothetical protein